MKRNENFEKACLQLNIENETDKKALDKILDIVFNYATYHDDGVEILNLIAKKNDAIIDYYFDLMKENSAQLAGIFNKAIKLNCIDLAMAMKKRKLYLNENYDVKTNIGFIEYSLEVAQRNGWTEMINLVTSIFNEEK